MTELELYRALGSLTKDKNAWQKSILYVGSLLEGQSPKITAKALWLLGEMGLRYPDDIVPFVNTIASFLDSDDDLLRERSLNALGRIGRARYETVKPYWDNMLAMAKDGDSSVRLAFIWASENIATNTPDPYGGCMPLFAELLHDHDDRVRMETPEMFRVMGKRIPEFVKPYVEQLRTLSEIDGNRVVRIHCLGVSSNKKRNFLREKRG